jgi:cytochrome c-type biogenesis protein CcmH
MSAATARRWGPWLLLGIVVVVALAIGTQSGGGSRTQAQRVQHIAGQLRCPVCEGETVADSNALISQDIRGVIQQQVAAGVPDSQIMAFIVHQYPGTLLIPPAKGVGIIVWALPVLAFVAAAAALTAAFVRWRSHPGVTASDADRELVERALRS